MPPMSQTSSETSAPPSAQQRWQGASSFLLFLLLLGSLVLYPYAENSTFGYYPFRVLRAPPSCSASTRSVSGAALSSSAILGVLYLAVLISRWPAPTGAQGLSINRQSLGFGSRIRRVPELACAALSRSPD